MMLSFNWEKVLVFVCISAAVLPSTVVSEKVLLSVFYESYCRASKEFIVNQVYPVYTQLSNEIQLDLIPYGNANTTMSKNGTLKFSCQHGPNECHANKLQVCALAHMEMKDAVSYINCTMSWHHTADANILCLKALGLGRSIKSNFIDCANTEEGDFLLAAYGVRTQQATPAIKWVPWIILDNKYDEHVADESRSDLLSVVCGYLKLKPLACRRINEM